MRRASLSVVGSLAVVALLAVGCESGQRTQAEASGRSAADRQGEVVVRRSLDAGQLAVFSYRRFDVVDAK